ncbi:hypothetical protein DIPPA_01177 [Diplonema papillatum]|nr:hypothetical protein DIPPA_01177 [Diplonema papillatum]
MASKETWKKGDNVEGLVDGTWLRGRVQKGRRGPGNIDVKWAGERKVSSVSAEQLRVPIKSCSVSPVTSASGRSDKRGKRPLDQSTEDESASPAASVSSRSEKRRKPLDQSTENDSTSPAPASSRLSKRGKKPGDQSTEADSASPAASIFNRFEKRKNPPEPSTKDASSSSSAPAAGRPGKRGTVPLDQSAEDASTSSRFERRKRPLEHPAAPPAAPATSRPDKRKRAHLPGTEQPLLNDPAQQPPGGAPSIDLEFFREIVGEGVVVGDDESSDSGAEKKAPAARPQGKKGRSGVGQRKGAVEDVAPVEWQAAVGIFAGAPAALDAETDAATAKAVFAEDEARAAAAAAAVPAAAPAAEKLAGLFDVMVQAFRTTGRAMLPFGVIAKLALTEAKYNPSVARVTRDDAVSVAKATGSAFFSAAWTQLTATERHIQSSGVSWKDPSTSAHTVAAGDSKEQPAAALFFHVVTPCIQWTPASLKAARHAILTGEDMRPAGNPPPPPHPKRWASAPAGGEKGEPGGGRTGRIVTRGTVGPALRELRKQKDEAAAEGKAARLRGDADTLGAEVRRDRGEVRRLASEINRLAAPPAAAAAASRVDGETRVAADRILRKRKAEAEGRLTRNEALLQAALRGLADTAGVLPPPTPEPARNQLGLSSSMLAKLRVAEKNDALRPGMLRALGAEQMKDGLKTLFTLLVQWGLNKVNRASAASAISTRAVREVQLTVSAAAPLPAGLLERVLRAGCAGVVFKSGAAFSVVGLGKTAAVVSVRCAKHAQAARAEAWDRLFASEVLAAELDRRRLRLARRGDQATLMATSGPLQVASVKEAALAISTALSGNVLAAVDTAGVPSDPTRVLVTLTVPNEMQVVNKAVKEVKHVLSSPTAGLADYNVRVVDTRVARTVPDTFEAYSARSLLSHRLQMDTLVSEVVAIKLLTTRGEQALTEQHRFVKEQLNLLSTIAPDVVVIDRTHPDAELVTLHLKKRCAEVDALINAFALS